MKRRQNKGKSNPVKHPATMRDVNRAKNEAFLQAVDFSLAIVFSVLLDKEGFNLFQIQRTWKEVQELSDSLEWNGERKSVHQWADEMGVSASTLKNRYYLGWSVKEILSLPVTRRKPRRRNTSA